MKYVYFPNNMKMKVFYMVLFLFVVTHAQIARYDNYRVYRLIPKTNDQVDLLYRLENNGRKFDFWKRAGKNGGVDIMVAPHQMARFHDTVKRAKIPFKIMIDNVQKLIDESRPRTKNTKGIDWNNYYDLNQIYDWLSSLSSQYPSIVEPIIGGRSYEGRSIEGVKVSFRSGNKGVFLEGGIHAREWITPATVTFILNQLLTSTDPGVREIAESYDWYVFPSVNPDGYTYTHTTDRLWRKTRVPHGECIGSDPNRNWGYHWNEGGNTSNNSCEETYAGPFPFSDPETKSLAEYIESIHDQLIGYLSIHSYSQLLLIPYGWSPDHVENYEELMEIGTKAIESLSQRYGTQFVVGNMAETIYPASGVSPDWVKGNFKLPIVYTYELRDTGKHGFLLPPELITPSGEELLDSLVTMMQEAKARRHY